MAVMKVARNLISWSQMNDIELATEVGDLVENLPKAVHPVVFFLDAGVECEKMGEPVAFWNPPNVKNGLNSQQFWPHTIGTASDIRILLDISKGT